MSHLLAALGAYLSTRLVTNPWRSREAFDAWQMRKLQAWLNGPARSVPRYRDFPAQLSSFPIIDKSVVMSAFAEFNVAGIEASQAWDSLQGSRIIGRYHIGASTGTSGNRGLYVISERERYLWLGTILAKALPDIWRRTFRVAIVLPTHTRLYDTANTTGRMSLAFFDLTQPLHTWLPRLLSLQPTVLVASPKIIRHLAQIRASIQPERIFSAAETLDPVDRAVIKEHFQGSLGEIYMATEGLLAVSCAHGSLHLAEDCNVFEFEDVAPQLVSPIISNFRRRSQIMARYRMNDLLRLGTSACACGSPLRTVSEIIGRMDDVFRLEGVAGCVLLTPDVLRNAVLDADRRITDFRIKCLTPRHVALQLSQGLPEAAGQAAHLALRRLMMKHGALAQVTLDYRPLTLDTTRKLRRVENLVGGGSP